MSTLGPEVGELCTMVGYVPDPEQQMLLDETFALNQHHKVSAFEVAAIVSRQNLKTGWMKQCALGWLFVDPQPLIVWSAHEFRTSREAFRDMQILIAGSDMLRRRVKKVYSGAGDESIELLTGERLLFKARTNSGGRGLTAPRVVLDEGFALTASHMGALLPTLSAVPDPQVIYGSSAGQARSDVLRSIRDRGRKGDDPSLAYAEWCAPVGGCAVDRCDHTITAPGCAMDDRANWQLGNPAMGRRITAEHIANERRAMPPEEFGRERLGWWDEPLSGTALFTAGRWESGKDVESQIVGGVSLGLAVTWDRSRATIGAAGLNASGRTHLEPVVSRRGTGWVVDEAVRLQTEHGGVLAVDGRGPASDLVPALESAGVRLMIAGTNDVLDAAAQLFDRVEQDQHSHLDDPDLNTAVLGAQKRLVGDRFALGRKQSTFDISPLEAVTLAAWGVSQASSYDPLDSIY